MCYPRRNCQTNNIKIQQMILLINMIWWNTWILSGDLGFGCFRMHVECLSLLLYLYVSFVSHSITLYICLSLCLLVCLSLMQHTYVKRWINHRMENCLSRFWKILVLLDSIRIYVHIWKNSEFKSNVRSLPTVDTAFFVAKNIFLAYAPT